MSANGAEKAVPCGTRKVIGVDFQGRCTRLLISGVPGGTQEMFGMVFQGGLPWLISGSL